MAKYVTLRDLVKRTGLSIATVSRALRDLPCISDEARTVVRQAARDMGYRADPVLAALSAHRWRRRPVAAGKTLAALADGFLDGEGGMAVRAATYGYHFEVFQIRAYRDARRLADVLYARGIQGVIVGAIHTPGFCPAFDWSRVSAVACNEGAERPPVHLVMPNHFRAVQQAWDWAWDHDFRRIGLAIFNIPNAIDLHDRRAAFLDRQQSVPPAQRVPVLTVDPWRGPRANPDRTGQVLYGEAVQRARMWMEQERPEIVLGFNDSFRWLLRDAGWRTPRWKGFVDLWVGDPAATGTRLDGDELGRRAVDWVDSLLRAGERGLPRNASAMLVDFEWQDGSISRRPGSPRVTPRGLPGRCRRTCRLP